MASTMFLSTMSPVENGVQSPLTRVVRTTCWLEIDPALPSWNRTITDKAGTTGGRALTIKEIRGRGLWIGIELHPEAGGARRFCEALQQAGMLCKETHEHVIRIAPPLVINREELDWAIEKVIGVLTGDRELQATT